MTQGDGTHDRRPTLAPEGELTIYRARTFRDEVAAALDEGQGVDLDLSAVTELDTACLQVMLAAFRAAQEQGAAVDVRQPSPAVTELFALYGLAHELDRTGRA